MNSEFMNDKLLEYNKNLDGYFNTKDIKRNHYSESSYDIDDIINLAWGAKEILRIDYKKSKWGDIILPFVVLRRLEGVLEPTKKLVLEEYIKVKEWDDKLIEDHLNNITGHHFHNQSPFNLDSLLADPKNIHRNLKNYIDQFSSVIRDVFINFKFDSIIEDLHKKNLLYNIVQHFTKTPIDVTAVDNHMMGTIYEELIRRASEAANEEAGDHFTPREVIRLLVNLLFCPDEESLKEKRLIRNIYDPAAGTGGMLSIASDHISNLSSKVYLNMFGQEKNDITYSICKSDMIMKGLDPNSIKYGNSLTNEDGFPNEKFHYMISNPPFGVDWGKYEAEIKEEEKGFDGKYGPGIPRKSDGSLLFLLQMISKMKPAEKGGSRIAIILNASPLFVGDMGSGESNIRKWIIENDLLEAIIALPDQLFYNTSISTYIWIIANNKSLERKGKIQLINAFSFYEKMKQSLGYKRKSISDKQINDILKLYKEFEINEISQIFDNSEFGYVRITIERPLKHNNNDHKPSLDQIIHHDLLDNNHKTSLEHLSKHIPDPKLRDYEYVSLNENIDQYFQHEVVPYVPDAWIDNSTRNNIGYEIPFKKYFYKYKSIRSIVDIDNDLKKLHTEIIKQIEELGK